MMVFAMLMEFKFRPVLGSSLLLGSTSGSEKNLVICVLRVLCIVTFCNLICIVVVFFNVLFSPFLFLLFVLYLSFLVACGTASTYVLAWWYCSSFCSTLFLVL